MPNYNYKDLQLIHFFEALNYSKALRTKETKETIETTEAKETKKSKDCYYENS